VKKDCCVFGWKWERRRPNEEPTFAQAGFPPSPFGQIVFALSRGSRAEKGGLEKARSSSAPS